MDKIKDTIKASLKSKRFWAGLSGLLVGLGFATGAVTVDAIGSTVCAVVTCTP